MKDLQEVIQELEIENKSIREKLRKIKENMNRDSVGKEYLPENTMVNIYLTEYSPNRLFTRTQKTNEVWKRSRDDPISRDGSKSSNDPMSYDPTFCDAPLDPPRR